MNAMDELLRALTTELREASAGAVVLMGSHARGTAHALSDVDVYVMGEGPECETRRVDGRLVTISWRTAETVRQSFVTLPGCIQAVPAWRMAAIVEDEHGVASELIEHARRWTWGEVEDPDGWCARELPGYAEEVQKVRAALASGDVMSAAIWRNVLGMRMAVLLAVHFRLLVEREEETWPLVTDCMGEEWGGAQKRALGLERSSFEEGCAAAIDLYRMAVEVIGPFMDEGQQAVAEGSLEGWSPPSPPARPPSACAEGQGEGSRASPPHPPAPSPRARGEGE